MKKILSLVFALSFMLCSNAQFVQQDSVQVSVVQADSAYIQGDWLTAIGLYENVIENQGVNATLYMNLGNAWLKLDEVAKAILCYERAYLLDPSDDDIKFNLELARTKTVDKVNPKNELFIVVWFRKVLSVLDVDGWGKVVVSAFLLTLILFGFFLFSKKIGVRKISFCFSVIFFVFSILSYIFATTQKGNILNRDTAIVMSPSVTVKSTPSSAGTDLFIIHEGRKVQILDQSMKEWVEIRLEDGNTGWIPVNVMEII